MKPHIQQKLLELVRRNYDDSATDFSRTRQHLPWPETEALVEKALVRLQPNNQFPNNQTTNVLDLGCGNGRLLDVLKRYDIDYTGIEQSSTLADHAKEKINRENIQNARVMTDDIVRLLTEPNHPSEIINLKFSLILLIAVLPHIPSRRLRIDVLRGIRRCLADNGRVVITCWNLRAHPTHKYTVRKHAILKLLGRNRMEFGDIVFPGFHDPGFKDGSLRYYHAYTKRELRKELAAAGFQIERLYSDSKNIYAVVRN